MQSQNLSDIQSRITSKSRNSDNVSVWSRFKVSLHEALPVVFKSKGVLLVEFVELKMVVATAFKEVGLLSSI